MLKGIESFWAVQLTFEQIVENESLQLIQAPPPDRLESWLREIYGKPVEVRERQLLRHRDLSFVERLILIDAMPESLIYKVVLPPWDIEQDLHERILIPEVSSSARLYLSGTYRGTVALFLEDLGTVSLLDHQEGDIAFLLGTELAKLHRAFTYRIAEVREQGILRTLHPLQYPELVATMTDCLKQWSLASDAEVAGLTRFASVLSQSLANEPISLVHGDLYAENLLFNKGKIYIIDWSWFTTIGAPIMDLATITMPHPKNNGFDRKRAEVVEAYCSEYSRPIGEVLELLPFAEALSRLLFLHWLIERRNRGILGTTVGHVDGVIPKIVAELLARLATLS